MTAPSSAAAPIKLYNSLSRSLEAFTPIDADGKTVRLYVCGPTVYDDAHLGHARCYITWDVLVRLLRWAGYAVTYVRNVTDVDDKIINRARERGVTPSEVAEKNYASFKEDMKRLNVLDPDVEPRATHHLQGMIDGIQALIDKQAAYVTSSGTVYFRVGAKADYGKLSGKPLDDLQSGARVDVDPEKESPLDFALWRRIADKDYDPTLHFQSPWGPGLPGWHMECSTMARSELADQIDIHAGGADLIFPHHENEIAQSETWTGKSPFAKYWLHNGFVNVSGEKMSKSLGNFSTIKTLLNAYDANTIRYFLLSHHYRMPVDFTDEALQGAVNWMARVKRELQKTLTSLNFSLEEVQPFLFSHYSNELEGIDNECSLEDPRLLYALRDLADDLNTPRALAWLNDLRSKMTLAGVSIQGLNLPDRPADPTAQKRFFILTINLMSLLGFDVIGLLAAQPFSVELEKSLFAEFQSEIHSALFGLDKRDGEALLSAIIQWRQQAKANKDWKTSDSIRDRLKAIGVQLMDHKDKPTTWELVAPVSVQP